MAPPAVATKVFLNDIPVQYIRPFEIRFSRGWEPWIFGIGVTDDRFDNLQNPITIRIETVSEFGGGSSVSVELENWHISTKVRHDEFSFDLFIEDPRHIAQYAKLSASYNVQWWGTDDGVFRQDTSNNGLPWKTVEAIKDALERFGLEVDDNPNLDPAILEIDLPANLGPSEGGGFGGVPYTDAMPILAETANIDIVCKPNGHVMIVDRYTDLVQNLGLHLPISGRVEFKDMHWSQPQRLEVLFPKRVERRFEYEEDDPIRTSAGFPRLGGSDFVNHIENVIPRFDPAVFTDDHLEFYDHVQENVGYARNLVNNRIKVPGIFPWGDPGFMRDMTAEKYERFRWFEAAMQLTWRTRFRVLQEGFAISDVKRPLANVRLGRLAKDGTTKGSGAVFMNYSRIHRYSHYAPGKGPGAKGGGGSIFDAEFSKNEPFSETIPAPFDAQWITDDVDELIFEVRSNSRSRLERQFWQGELFRPLQYGDIADIAAGKPIELVEASVNMNDKFKMFIYYHGLQITDIGTSVEFKRMHRIRFDLFPNGEGPTLEIRAGDLTANYEFNTTRGNANDNLPQQDDIINETELQREADYVALEIANSYINTQHGSLTFGSIEPLASGLITDGNIFDTVIQIGYNQEFSCSLTYMVMPSITQGIKPREARSGKQARIVDGGK